MNMRKENKKIETLMPIDYILNDDNTGKKLYILLHGFGETAQKIHDFIVPLLPENSSFLIPNGLFPVVKAPGITEGKKKKLGYAWYFYDSQTDQYLIDYQCSAIALANLITDLGYSETEKIIIGYSQGGYLAPFLGEKCRSVKSILGLSCVFKHQFLGESLDYKLFGVHGTEDLLVDYNNSLNHFNEIKKRTRGGDYLSLPGEGHRLNLAFKAAITKRLPLL